MGGKVIKMQACRLWGSNWFGRIFVWYFFDYLVIFVAMLAIVILKARKDDEEEKKELKEEGESMGIILNVN